jgi:hypothetical protein
MIATRALPFLLVFAAACSDSGGTAGGDAGPTPIMYMPFTSDTWSLTVAGGAAQISITDQAGAAACALSTDQHNALGGAGAQIILTLPGAVTDACPVGHFSMTPAGCPAALGDHAFVQAGCSYYRRFDATGASLGNASAINGEITINGDATSCTIRTNVGFLGANFGEIFTLDGGTGATPWCQGSS